MKDTAKGLSKKLKLDSHHAIERFGVTMGVMTALFALLFVSTLGSSVLNNHTKLDSTALYTSSFTTSKSQLTGSVPGVYISPDHQRAMVMMKFEDSSSGSFSANAENYQGFLTGSDAKLNTESLDSDIKGSIMMFGSTGYMGVVLDSDQPFAQQILNLTLRANSELVYQDEPGKLRKDLKDDNSFAAHDQWRLFVNPGASGAKETEALAGNKVDAGAIYADLVINPQEEKVRTDMDQQLAQMQVDQKRIAEFEDTMATAKTVDGVKIVPPKVPKQIRGDEITGEPATAEGLSTLDMKTDWVSPRGYGFDWRSGSVAEGYLEDLVPKDSSYSKFLSKKADIDTDESFQVNDLVWKLSDGSNLKEDYDSSDSAVRPLTEVMNNLSQAYQDYYKHKVKYQEDSYSDLLELEVSLRNVESGYSLNDADETMLRY